MPEYILVMKDNDNNVIIRSFDDIPEMLVAEASTDNYCEKYARRHVDGDPYASEAYVFI